MVRSRRSLSKEDAASILADSGISVSSPPLQLKRSARLHEEDDGNRLAELCVTDDDDAISNTRDIINLNAIENLVALSNDANGPASLNGSDSAYQLVLQAGQSLPAKELLIDDGKLTTSLPLATGTKRSRKSYICGICHKKFGGNTDLKRHQLIHSDEKPFKCEQCGKCYRQSINLKNHITTAHARQKRFSCEQCPKAFALKERLKLHMRLHSGEKPYACDQCDKRFARGGQLHQHTVSHHQDGPKRFKCEICCTHFSTSLNLKAHMERHKNGPEHYCDVCNEHFVNDVLLRTHVTKMHYKLKQLVCDICKESVEEHDFREHVKSHVNIKSYICTMCNSIFTQKSQYNVHLRMHTGERPYQCMICCQTFAHSSVLKLHIRKHTGEKPFNCLLCKDDVAFSQLAHLKTHMKKIHQQSKPYMCEGCHEFFKVKVELESHYSSCEKYTNNIEEQDARCIEEQTLSHIRLNISILLKKISSDQKLQQLGFEKRLVDNVIIESLKLAKRKVYDDNKMSAIERIRLNIEEFLNWTVPTKLMERFRKEKLTVDNILEKIATMYTKHK